MLLSFVISTINLGLISVIVLFLRKNKIIGTHWASFDVHLGALIGGWVAWSSLLGILFIFDALEASMNSFHAFMLGLRLATSMLLAGLLVFCIFLFLYVHVKFKRD